VFLGLILMFLGVPLGWALFWGLIGEGLAKTIDENKRHLRTMAEASHEECERTFS
jgi:hypothetical protein